MSGLDRALSELQARVDALTAAAKQDDGLEERIKKAEATLRGLEADIRTAQKLATQARGEADRIVAEAREQAFKINADAEKQAVKLLDKAQKVLDSVNGFKGK